MVSNAPAGRAQRSGVCFLQSDATRGTSHDAYEAKKKIKLAQPDILQMRMRMPPLFS